MTDETDQTMTILNRLLGSFPATGSGSDDEILDGFLIAVGDIPSNFLAAAAARFLQGQVDGHNKKFAPSPAELSSEARKIWHREARRIEQDRASRLQIESRPAHFTPEELERRKSFADGLLRTLKHTPDAESQERSARSETRRKRMDKRFLDNDPRSMAERLKMSGTGA